MTDPLPLPEPAQNWRTGPDPMTGSEASEILLLSTLVGAEDLLAAELRAMGQPSPTRTATSGVSKLQFDGAIADLRACRMYSHAAIPLESTEDGEPQLEPLRRSGRAGVLAAMLAAQSTRFRIGVRDAALRKQIIGRVESDLGWRNDPSNWVVNITPHAPGWKAELGALHYSRRFGAYVGLPWSATPLVAEALIRLAKLRTGCRVHDPCCGTATLLIVASEVAAAEVTGTDHDQKALTLAEDNLATHRVEADLRLANATPFPAADRSLDRIVSNLPFGKLVGSHERNASLYPALTHEIARTLTADGRAVLLTEDKRLLRDSTARTKGLKIVKERVLRYGGSTPTAFTLVRSRR